MTTIQKAPETKSKMMDWASVIIPAGLFAVTANSFGFSYNFLPLLPYAGAGMAITGATLMLARPKIENTLESAFRYSGIYTESKQGVRLPRLTEKEGFKNGVKLKYDLPVGLCASDFMKQWERLEQAVKGEMSFSNDKGGLTMEVLFGNIPDERGFHFPDFPKDYQLGIPIGWSRAGLIVEDLAEMPHLLVAGTTYGGKSVFLHGAVACLLQNPKADLFVVDLARAEFSYTKKHADFSYTVDGAQKALSFLHIEMERRLDILDRYKIEKIQLYPHDDLQYLVLVVDEFSALSPALIRDRKHPEKKKREECQFLLNELLSRARKVGIHIILSTQRPDADVIPGILKANIPATICFKVRNRINSEICLDHGRAALLPDVKGRAIWQFKEEREIQVMHLGPGLARTLLPAEERISEDIVTPPLRSGEF